MNIKKYLDRIHYQGDLIPRMDVLKELQKAHLLNVPFENLDVHYGNPIKLDLDRIYQKVIEKERGGFCYELNGLFYHLLTQLGFDAMMISARVYQHDQKEFGLEFDHLAIMVNLDQAQYLVDVGFGEFTFSPLKFELNNIQSDPRGNFIIEKYEGEYYKISKDDKGEKTNQYLFTNRARSFDEFKEMCVYHQTSPDSHFTKNKLISKPTINGRITITGNTLKITENDLTKVEEVFPEEAYQSQLLKWFNLEEQKIKAGH